MIRLHPIPATRTATCPTCDVDLSIGRWHIVGARNIVERPCPNCLRIYYQDLPVSHALYKSALFDPHTHQTHVKQPNWYTQGWQSTYASRTDEPVKLTIEAHRPLGERPIILLNTLDSYYGHSLLKLFNADYYLTHYANHDLVILIQPFLRWLIPEGVAQIWTAHIPLRNGDRWYDDLDRQVHIQLDEHDKVNLSVALSHPDARDFNIQHFTGVPSFNLNQWHERPLTVTYIWRDDRVWQHPIPIGRLRNFFVRRPDSLTQQRQRVNKLANTLHQLAPEVDFAIAGVGKFSPLPGHVKDMRSTHITDEQERAWVDQYARSHIVIGVHGSNMLLPTAHAGASIALMPPERWNNQVQDTIVQEVDPRLAQIRYKHISLETDPATLARITLHTYSSLLRHRQHYVRPYTDHNYLRDHWHDLDKQ